MNIQEKIIQNYPLVNKIDFELNCYLLDKRRYLIFWNELIKKDSIEKMLNYLEEKTKNPNFTESKTLIVVGKTKEKFKKVDLVYFNSVNTLVVFYLINEETNEIYMDDSWISFIGLNYKKYVRKINEILNK
ncbi:unknown [Firmicutes bacterium CAG:313]|nr:unknown [Firmicutes bacterium CAG:313]